LKVEEVELESECKMGEEELQNKDAKKREVNFSLKWQVKFG
jgi:hypothetical protein